MFRELIAQCVSESGAEYAYLEPSCPEDEITQAENAVGYPFPEELKALLRETNGDHWLLWSAKEMVECAEQMKGFLDVCDTYEDYLEKVGRHIFFAGNGCGDYYCYRILPTGMADGSGVYIWGHETFESHVVAKDLPDLIRKYYHGQC